MKRDGVEDERVALPLPHGIPQIGQLELRLSGALAAIGRDYSETRGIRPRHRRPIDKGHVVLRLEDAPGWALPRHSQRLAGHHRTLLVRPHVELLNFVPVLRLVRGDDSELPNREGG